MLRCLDCRYFRPLPVPPQAGECFLNPPQPLMRGTNIVYVRPQIFQNDLCGAFVPDHGGAVYPKS